MGNELTTQTKTVSMMSVQRNYIDNIGKGLESIIGNMTKYQALCGYNVLNKINTALAKDGLDHRSPNVDKTSINDAIKFCVSYELNTDNNEVFVIIRNTKLTDPATKQDKWVKVIECKPQYRGVLKIVSTFGRNVKTVYPEWIVREGDTFKYSKMVGISIVPPEWERKDSDGRIARVVVPVEYNDGFIDYRIAERESIAVNIKAQINQTLLGKDKTESARVKTLMKDMSLDELLKNDTLAPYINETYKGISSEEMIITKLVINATKRIPIEFKNAFTRELYEKTYDNADVYKKNHDAEELAANENKQIPVVDDYGEVKQVEEKPKAKKVEKVKVEELPTEPKPEPVKEIPNEDDDSSLDFFFLNGEQ